MLIFENLFGKEIGTHHQHLKDFWLREGAITDNEILNTRLAQAVFIIRDQNSNEIAGVSTAEKKQLKALNNLFFYEFRCFIGQASRKAGLDVKLSKLTFDFLETRAKSDIDHPIGVFSILENVELQKHPVWRRAVWPEIDMHLVGFTREGNPMRIHYFKGARI